MSNLKKVPVTHVVDQNRKTPTFSHSFSFLGPLHHHLPILAMEDFDQFVVRQGTFCVCTLCGLFKNKTITNVRCHIESKHFPGTFAYACPMCGKQMISRTSLRDHTAACKRAFVPQ